QPMLKAAAPLDAARSEQPGHWSQHQPARELVINVRGNQTTLLIGFPLELMEQDRSPDHRQQVGERAPGLDPFFRDELTEPLSKRDDDLTASEQALNGMMALDDGIGIGLSALGGILGQSRDDPAGLCRPLVSIDTQQPVLVLIKDAFAGGALHVGDRSLLLYQS